MWPPCPICKALDKALVFLKLFPPSKTGCYSLSPTGRVPTAETRGPAWDVVVVVVVTTICVRVLQGGHPALRPPASLNLLTHVAP